jgi:integrase
MHHFTMYAGIVSPFEQRNRRRYMEIILEILSGDTPVHKINRATVQAFVVYLRVTYRSRYSDKPLAGGTRKAIIGMLRRALDHAVDAEILDANPAVRLPQLLRPSARPITETQFYTIEQAGAILSALLRLPDGSRPSDWPVNAPDYLYEQVAFALLTGARRNEIRAQRWEWIDWDRGLVHIHTSKRQRGESRDVLLPRTLPL